MTQLQASLKTCSFSASQFSKSLQNILSEQRNVSFTYIILTCIKTFLEQFHSFILSYATKKAKSEAKLVQKGESDMLPSPGGGTMKDISQACKKLDFTQSIKKEAARQHDAGMSTCAVPVSAPPA